MNKHCHYQRGTRIVIQCFLGIFATFLITAGSHAGEILKTERLADNIYALIGPLANRNPENLGNNANFGVIVTEDGVILIDSGATYKGAEMIHSTIHAITDKPIKFVINSGGQDHRWLGNSYFKERGAHIIASEKAVIDQKSRLQDQLYALENLVGIAGLEGTEPVYADEVFSHAKSLTVGKIRIEIKHMGHAHTPGDSFVWLPDQQIVFSGDIVYVERMLGIGPQSAHQSWISTFESIAALNPKVVIGGHGNPADLSKATADTYDYLVFLREAIQEFMDQGGGIEEIGKIDQSRFDYLENFESLKGRNAQRVFEELEWE